MIHPKIPVLTWNLGLLKILKSPLGTNINRVNNWFSNHKIWSCWYNVPLTRLWRSSTILDGIRVKAETAKLSNIFNLRGTKFNGEELLTNIGLMTTPVNHPEYLFLQI